MIINKLKIGFITLAMSLFAIPSVSAHTVKHFKRPAVISKVAAILDIRVDVLRRELRDGESILNTAKEFNASKSEIKQIKKVLRVARNTKVIVKPVVVIKKTVIIRPGAVKRVVRTVIIRKPAHVVHVKRPLLVKRIASILDTSVASVISDLKQGDSLMRIAKENNATKVEVRQLQSLKSRQIKIGRHSVR